MAEDSMDMHYGDRVLSNLRNLVEDGKPIGYAVDVRFNYYRGTAVSAIERLELAIDGTTVPDDALLAEINGTYLRVRQLPLAFTEYWGVRVPLRLHVFGAPLAAGEHDVRLALDVRAVDSQIAPGVFDKLDGSAPCALTVEA